MRHSSADAIAAAAEVAVGKGDQRSGSIPKGFRVSSVRLSHLWQRITKPRANRPTYSTAWLALIGGRKEADVLRLRK